MKRQIKQTEPTVAELKKFVRNPRTRVLLDRHTALVKEAARLKAEVAALYTPILAKYRFVDASGNSIKDTAHVYLSDDDEAVNKYFAETEDAIAGYGLPYGVCPALKAQRTLVDHEQQMIETMAGFMGVAAPTQINLRTRMIKLFLELPKSVTANETGENHAKKQ